MGESAVTCIQLSFHSVGHVHSALQNVLPKHLKQLLKNKPLRNKSPFINLQHPALITWVTCRTWAHSPQNPVGCIFMPTSQVAKTSKSINKACSQQTTALVKTGLSLRGGQPSPHLPSYTTEEARLKPRPVNGPPSMLVICPFSTQTNTTQI